MLSGGFTGQLFGEFTKAMRVYGGYVYVRCASRECWEHDRYDAKSWGNIKT